MRIGGEGRKAGNGAWFAINPRLLGKEVRWHLPAAEGLNMLAPVNGDNVTPAVTPAGSSEAATADSPTVLSLTELGKNSHAWTLTLHPSHLALAETPDERPYVILREQVMKSAMLIEGMGAFVLSKPRKVTFKLTPEATAAVAEWIGKPVLAAFYLKRRYGWVLPVAVIWMIGSLPMPGSSSGDLEPKPFDLVGFGLGLTLVVSWAFAKWRPHPGLFLVDSLWFLWLAGYLAVEVLHGRSRVWLLLVAMLLWMAVTGFKHFARFRGTRFTRVSA